MHVERTDLDYYLDGLDHGDWHTEQRPPPARGGVIPADLRIMQSRGELSGVHMDLRGRREVGRKGRR